MNDLNALLERAAGPATAPFDAYADLTRAQRALSRTRRRRRALGLAGVAAAGVVGVGIERFSGQGDLATDRTAASDPTVPTATPAPPDVTAGPYTFPALPDGWEVQSARPQVVTIAPVGFPDQQPLSFLGKLVIGYDQNPPSGEKVQRDGRTFWVNDGGDTAIVSARTRPGEPDGEVTVQFPTAAFSTDDMITFLAGVHVGPGAEPALG
ncbi:MAG TPA: hypothetical protein VFV89_19330 [Nocardioides sp.]|uniref:hypothetical protein n=1 Tax=Nocardioides sp. TaxID=35761 RepID=UPI002E33858E|nr:hypothetical protein [Nocardioides sp.]HEX5089969.1 hypothetical protein [Nocardioides sp.]